jgi:hypothetical protein
LSYRDSKLSNYWHYAPCCARSPEIDMVHWNDVSCAKKHCMHVQFNVRWLISDCMLANYGTCMNEFLLQPYGTLQAFPSKFCICPCAHLTPHDGYSLWWYLASAGGVTASGTLRTKTCACVVTTELVNRGFLEVV